jgi:hypothetical protein
MNEKVKKAPVTRVYPITVEDGPQVYKTRYIEASSPAQAVTHTFAPQIGEPLTVQEVMDVIRTKGADAIEKVAAPATKAE